MVSFTVPCGALACGATDAAPSPDAASDAGAVPPDAAADAVPPDAAADAGDVIASDAPPCQATAQSDLPGAHIAIDASRCVFTLAEARAGITVAYEIVIDAAIPNVVP